jgi:hypothetical protein
VKLERAEATYPAVSWRIVILGASRNRKQQGQIIRIGDRWYVRYWERRNIGGTVERKRVTHSIGEVTTRGKRPPADIKTEAERHMATVNSGTVPADRIVTIGDFVERVYLVDHRTQAALNREGLSGHLGRSSKTALCGRLAERRPHLPRPKLAKSDRRGQA